MDLIHELPSFVFFASHFIVKKTVISSNVIKWAHRAIPVMFANLVIKIHSTTPEAAFLTVAHLFRTSTTLARQSLDDSDNTCVAITARRLLCGHDLDLALVFIRAIFVGSTCEKSGVKKLEKILFQL